MQVVPMVTMLLILLINHGNINMMIIPLILFRYQDDSLADFINCFYFISLMQFNSQNSSRVLLQIVNVIGSRCSIAITT